MSKLSLDALKERAEAVASEELLNSISGGTENACHDDTQEEEPSLWERFIDYLSTPPTQGGPNPH